MSNISSQPFDPYHKWLGISSAEQPPTWYRLLGIPLFESDPDVIDAAADQRMAHLRKYQTGANSALSQQLLNEVASARIALLSPDKKGRYDAELRAKIAVAKPVVAGSGESSAIGRGKAEASAAGDKRPPRLPVAVTLDSPVPAAAAPAPAVIAPPVKPPPVDSTAGAPASAAFTPMPIAIAHSAKPKGPANLIVGICVAGGIALLGLAYWLIQGQGTGRPNTPLAAEAPGPRPESRPAAVPANPVSLPKPDPVKVPDRPVPPSSPVLLFPADGAVLIDRKRPENQGKGWDFRWLPVAQAVKYHLRVTSPSGNDPLIDKPELTDSFFHYNGIVPPAGADRHGWRWKVRAMGASQAWSDWSSERKFDVQPEPPPLVAGPVEPAAKPDVAPKPVKPSKELAPAAPETPVAETPSRAAVPDEAALAKASKDIVDIYGAEHDAARSPAQKVILAKKFLEQAATTRNDPAAHYVLAKSARDLASQAGDAGLAFQAIDEMSAAFDVDGTAMKIDAVSRAAKATLAPAQLKVLVDQILALMDELVDQDRYDDALALAPVALERARRLHDNALSKQVNQHRKEVEATRRGFAEIQPLAERLRTQPDDAEANYRVGRYTAAIKGDWKKALPMLAKGGDASWKTLAQQELAFPSDTRDQLALANGWWDVGQSAEDAEKNNLLAHAGTWYRKVQPDVSAGLDKARVEKRLAELDQLDQPSRGPEARKTVDFKLLRPVDILKRVDVARDKVAGQWKRAAQGIAGTGAMAHTRLMLPVVIDGSYDLQIAYAPVNRFDQVIVILPIGSRGCAIYVGTTTVGIYAKQEGAFAGGFRTVTSQFFRANGRPQHVLLISVRLEGDTVKLAVAEDGVMLLNYACLKDSLDVPAIYALPSPGHPGLGAMQTDTAIFGAVTLRMVSGKASWAETPAASQPAESPDNLPNNRPADPNKPPRVPADQPARAKVAPGVRGPAAPEIPDVGVPTPDAR